MIILDAHGGGMFSEVFRRISILSLYLYGSIDELCTTRMKIH